MKADDHGCYYGDARLLKADLFPLLLDNIREADLLRWTAECEKAGLIVLYESEGKKYVQIQEFRQRLDKARSKFPLPDSNGFPEVVNEFRAEVEVEIETEPESKKGAIAPPTATPSAPPQEKGGKVKEKQEAMVKRRDEFYKLLIPHVETYSKDLIRAFFEYWTEPNKSRTRMKFELEETWDVLRRLTTWENKELKWKKGAPDRPASTPKKTIPELSKTQEEVNYLFERYLEDPGSITVISIDAQHYNFLKTSSLLQFSQEETDRIKTAAGNYLTENKLEATGDIQLRFMKKFGVLEFFKQLKTNGKKTVFRLDRVAEKV